MARTKASNVFAISPRSWAKAADNLWASAASAGSSASSALEQILSLLGAAISIARHPKEVNHEWYFSKVCSYATLAGVAVPSFNNFRYNASISKPRNNHCIWQAPLGFCNWHSPAAVAGVWAPESSSVCKKIRCVRLLTGSRSTMALTTAKFFATSASAMLRAGPSDTDNVPWHFSAMSRNSRMLTSMSS